MPAIGLLGSSAAAGRAGDRKLAARYFEQTIALEADHAEALNYLGYMWAEQRENLPRARELIERALKLEPENDAFLDSLRTGAGIDRDSADIVEVNHA